MVQGLWNLNLNHVRWQTIGVGGIMGSNREVQVTRKGKVKNCGATCNGLLHADAATCCTVAVVAMAVLYCICKCTLQACM